MLEPIKTFAGVVSETQLEAATGAAIEDSEWTKVVNSVDVVGSGTYCSPYNRMSFNSIIVGSKCVG